jgi:hypothetical protein
MRERREVISQGQGRSGWYRPGLRRAHPPAVEVRCRRVSFESRR